MIYVAAALRLIFWFFKDTFLGFSFGNVLPERHIVTVSLLKDVWARLVCRHEGLYAKHHLWSLRFLEHLIGCPTSKRPSISTAQVWNLVLENQGICNRAELPWYSWHAYSRQGTQLSALLTTEVHTFSSQQFLCGHKRYWWISGFWSVCGGWLAIPYLPWPEHNGGDKVLQATRLFCFILFSYRFI